MPLPTPAARSARRLLPLLAAALFFAAAAVPAAVQAAPTTTVLGEPFSPATTGVSAEPFSPSTTASPGVSPGGPTTVTSGQAAPSGSTAVVPPPAGQATLNPGWKTEQMQIQVLPEYDQKAVLVVLNFSLPADVQLPATLKLPVPTGAVIAGIGEIDPNGQYKYNYANSYPPIQAGTPWDIASIEVKDFRDLQIDYYYDPGLPAGAGNRSFPLLIQVPLDVATLILHVQQPARATDFQIQPALQGSGQAGDGFTYEVATYSDVKGGSTLGNVVSYSKPDGGLSTDSGQSGSSRVSMTSALLGVLLFVVVVVAAVIIYLLYAKSRKGTRKPGPAKAQRSPAKAPASQAARRQQANQKYRKGTIQKAGTPRAAKSVPPPAVAGDERPAGARTAEAASDQGDEAEYCTVCGEELTDRFRYCPNCGEPRP